MGGAFTKLDNNANKAILAAAEAGLNGAKHTVSEMNVVIINGMRLSLMNAGLNADLPTTISTYMERETRDRLSLTNRKPEYLPMARWDGQTCPETTLCWAFLVAAYASNLPAELKSNIDGCTLTIPAKGTGVSVTVTRESVQKLKTKTAKMTKAAIAAAAAKDAAQGKKQHMGKRKGAPVKSGRSRSPTWSTHGCQPASTRTRQ